MDSRAIFAKLAFRNVFQGGQRILISLLCIIFAVISLIALTTVSSAFEKAFVTTPEEMIGGNITITDWGLICFNGKPLILRLEMRIR